VPPDDGGAAITGYEIYRGSSAGAETLHASVANVQTYTDTGLTNGTTYWYQVAAMNSAGPGTRSNEVSATPQAAATAPSAPLNLAGAKLADGIRLTWSAPSSNGGSAVTGYRVHRSTVAGAETFLVEVLASQLSYTDASVQRRTPYYFYVVTAVNVSGEGPPSNEVKVRNR
jgi:predicted phage tail protein